MFWLLARQESAVLAKVLPRPCFAGRRARGRRSVTAGERNEISGLDIRRRDGLEFPTVFSEPRERRGADG